MDLSLTMEHLTRWVGSSSSTFSQPFYRSSTSPDYPTREKIWKSWSCASNCQSCNANVTPIKPNRVEKITLAVLTARLKRTTHRSTNQLRDVIRIFQPEIILRWYRELVRRKEDQNDRTRTNTRSARLYPESREKVSARFHPILRDAIEIHHGFIF